MRKLFRAAALFFNAVILASSQTFEVIYADSSGLSPQSGLVQGSDGDFYGTTSAGGASGLGTVFKVSEGGTCTVLHSFTGSTGSYPRASLMQGSDGDFYGTTSGDGARDFGTVFKITASGTHTMLHSFDSTMGRYPSGLVMGTDGDFYGTTSAGGTSDFGTVFKVTASGTHTVLHSFDSTMGHYPTGLVMGTDGDFYGTTSGGGISGFGTVFKITANGTHTVLHSFSGSTGSYPQASLVQGSDGDFYGTTLRGGSGFGTVFKITASGTHTVLHSFSGNNGSHPQASLVQGSDGDFYGTTSGDGDRVYGTVFKITASGTHSVLHSFETTNGRNPAGGLVQGSDGEFYVTTSSGGTSDYGTVFKVTASGTHTMLHSFDSTMGRYPSGLVMGTDGDFYGTTSAGGTSDFGTVFKVTASGTHTVLHSFSGNNGRNPVGGLVQGTDGDFYGTTSEGSESGFTIFKITANGVHSALLNSYSGAKGSLPAGGLIQGKDGDFYGTTQSGGTNESGTVYRFTASGSHILLHSFNFNNGRFPSAGLVQGSDGDFYGTTSAGGAYNYGTVFKFSASGTHSVLHSFNSANGSEPRGRLVQGSDGDFYGTTSAGGAYNYGTVFKITANGTHTVLHSFGGNQGIWPSRTPIFGADGNLYGTAYPMVVWKIRLGSPAIAIHGNGQHIANGDGTPNTVDYTHFGSVLAGGTPLVRIFTISNDGTAALNLSGTPLVAIWGSPAFSVNAQPISASVAANSGAQSFAISFAPATTGLHTAVVSIDNEATGANPFTFTLAGEGAEAGSIAFSAATHSSSSRSAINVILQRLGGTTATSVTLSTSDGSAGTVPPFAAALAGTDYEALSTVVDFAEGETSKVVPITLLPRSGTLPNRRFTVALSDPTGGATLGAITSAEVHLLASDPRAPTLTVKFPTATATLVTQAAPIVVQGIAGDALGLDQVEIDYGGATYLATLGAASKPTSVPWSFELTPPGDGPVSLVIRAYDLSGNVTTVKRSFDFIRRYPVTMTRQVPAGLSSPDEAGMVRLTSIKGDFSALMPSNGALEQTGTVVPQSQVNLEAKAAAGYIFSNWEGLPAEHAVAGAVARFKMPAEEVTGITAIFVENPFTRGSMAALGPKPVFQGLLRPDNMITPGNDAVGFLSATLVPTKGSLSGKLWMDGKTTSFAAALHGDGSVWFQSGKSQSATLPFHGRELVISWDYNHLTISILDASNIVSTGLAQPPLYSKGNPIRGGLLDAKGKQGDYTLILPATPQTPAKPSTDYPQGTGFARLTLQRNGNLKLAGKLADGTSITAASYLVADDASEWFIPLPTPGSKTLGGSLLGRLSFDAGNPGREISSDGWRWFRPPAATKAELPQAYRAGWPEGLAVDVLGARYDSSQGVQTALNLAMPGPGGNARLVFSQGKLASNVEVAFNLSGNKVLKLEAADKSYRLVVNAKTGLFQGSFTPGWSSAKPPAFQGILLLHAPYAGGHGFFLGNASGDPDPESGFVELTAP
jgi:uncharacterized repeat protein (TIGR03803 family)